MLVPDFEVGSDDFPVGRVTGSRLTEGTENSVRKTTNGTHELEGHNTEDAPPLRKRLRTIGQAFVDSALEMAPGWARAVLWGHALGADALGQSGKVEDGDSAMATADQIKDLMDAGARRLGKVAVIGIHGWFPMRMLQMLAGEPTGTSEKFCAMMRDALKTHLRESHGVEIANDDISLFPLIGEGRIEDRVELLLSQITEPGEISPKAAATESTDPSGKQSVLAAEALMPPRRRRAEVLQAADTVFIVTHSQGTPVAAMVVERLLEMGLVDTVRQRVAMLAMAGISHGPLAYLKDNVVVKYIESGTARELFELMDPSSYQSQRYVAALSTILHSGVRLVCIGSWVDEVVPLYSAILQGVSHPNVYRAVYIDAPHYLDDFLTNLIVFALRLRNMGIYDHDLLIYLSEVVAGSLWGHWGHSTVYGEPAVYRLAIKWLLYSTLPASCAPLPAESVPADMRQHPGARQCASGPRIHMSYRPFNATEQLNPFFIPWIMRTLWDEPAIQNNQALRAELKRLVALYDKWVPETKAGKDLKYRLEPVRAAL